ncbi:MAG: sigma 54-interacting transcriptional regulator [Spirochaetia bacterium]|nr:sigma 54-interacting transcriptional regulator [Spirochaetia bacterium]
MPSIQIISSNEELKRGIKQEIANNYEIYSSTTLKEGIRNIQKNAIDLLLVDIKTTGAIQGKWLKNTIITKEIFSGEMSILLIAPYHFLNKENFHQFIKPDTEIQDIFWLSGDNFCALDEKKAFQFFLRKNINSLESKRNNRLLILKTDSLLHEKKTFTDIQEIAGAENQMNMPCSFLVGESKSSENLRALLLESANQTENILFLGDKGLQQEKMALYIHLLSIRKENLPFVAVDCSKVPHHLQTEFFFGCNSKAGVETGAFERAQEGTLFIDSIESLSWEIQEELLKTMRQKSFSKVRGKKKIPLKCRLIFSAEKKIEKKVEKGLFRQDLFFRVQVFPILIPGMKSRKTDLIDIINNYAQWFNKKQNKKIKLTPNLKQALESKEWKNIEDLYKTLKKIYSLSDSENTDIGILTSVENNPEILFSEYGFLRENNAKTNQMFLFQEFLTGGHEPKLHEIEIEYINKVLKTHKGNISEAARILGITRKTLHQKLKKYTLDKSKKAAAG